jgi:hypothetical protein
MARKTAGKAKPVASMPELSEVLLDNPEPTSAAIENPMPVADSCTEVSNHEKIELLAYSYWMERGCPGGSPDEDWFRAEREINRDSSN